MEERWRRDPRHSFNEYSMRQVERKIDRPRGRGGGWKDIRVHNCTNIRPRLPFLFPSIKQGKRRKSPVAKRGCGLSRCMDGWLDGGAAVILRILSF